MSEQAKTPMSDRIQHFWSAISEPHVRILVDMRRDHEDGSFHWDSSSFGDDVAKALVGSRASAPAAKDCDRLTPAIVGAMVAAMGQRARSYDEDGAYDDYRTVQKWADSYSKASRSAATTVEPVAWQRRYRSDCRGWELISKEFYDQLCTDKIEFNETELELRPLYATPPSVGNADAVRAVLEPFIAELARQERVRSYRDGDCNIVDCRLTIGALRRLAALSAPVDGAWQEALGKGFMTACSGDGEYQIKIGFETLKDMQAAHMALCKSAYAHTRNERGGPANG